jgi:tRNA A37 threonylcarbamoyltransferase TsaD
VHVNAPPLELCTGDAAMIVAAAHYRFLCGERSGLDAEPVASTKLDAGLGHCTASWCRQCQR